MGAHGSVPAAGDEGGGTEGGGGDGDGGDGGGSGGGGHGGGDAGGGGGGCCVAKVAAVAVPVAVMEAAMQKAAAAAARGARSFRPNFVNLRVGEEYLVVHRFQVFPGILLEFFSRAIFLTLRVCGLRARLIMTPDARSP